MVGDFRFPGVNPYFEKQWDSILPHFAYHIYSHIKLCIPKGLTVGLAKPESDSSYNKTKYAPVCIQICSGGLHKKIVTAIHIADKLQYTSNSYKVFCYNYKNYLISNNINYVEFKLIRDVDNVEDILDSGNYSYKITVINNIKQKSIYLIKLIEKLPIVNIPLRIFDNFIALYTQELYDRSLRSAGYDKNYYINQTLDLPFTAHERSLIDSIS